MSDMEKSADNSKILLVLTKFSVCFCRLSHTCR